jgi:hypothetical protein
MASARQGEASKSARACDSPVFFFDFTTAGEVLEACSHRYRARTAPLVSIRFDSTRRREASESARVCDSPVSFFDFTSGVCFIILLSQVKASSNTLTVLFTFILPSIKTMSYNSLIIKINGLRPIYFNRTHTPYPTANGQPPRPAPSGPPPAAAGWGGQPLPLAARPRGPAGCDSCFRLGRPYRPAIALLHAMEIERKRVKKRPDGDEK